MAEAYSHEVSSCGYWPGAGPEGVFYSYADPIPPRFAAALVRPAEARWSEDFGEFLLPYEIVRLAADPKATLREFLQSTYEAAADAGEWDRDKLERQLPQRPGSVHQRDENSQVPFPASLPPQSASLVTCVPREEAVDRKIMLAPGTLIENLQCRCAALRPRGKGNKSTDVGFQLNLSGLVRLGERLAQLVQRAGLDLPRALPLAPVHADLVQRRARSRSERAGARSRVGSFLRPRRVSALRAVELGHRTPGRSHSFSSFLAEDPSSDA